MPVRHPSKGDASKGHAGILRGPPPKAKGEGERGCQRSSSQAAHPPSPSGRPLPMLLGNRRMRRQPSISAFKRRSVSETGSDEARGALLMGIRRPRGFEHDSALEVQHSSLDFSPCNRTAMVFASTPPDTRDRTQAQHLFNRYRSLEQSIRRREEAILRCLSSCPTDAEIEYVQNENTTRGN